MNYITAAQAREMGAWNAEYFQGSEGWMVCDPFCYYAEGYKYRAIKQAQPEPPYRKIEGVDHDPRYEPVDPHADNFAEESHPAYRAMYAKQVAEGTTGFYLWEVLEGDTWKKRDSINNFYPVLKYRCTDISCYVSKDGEPAVRMLRTEAQELQRSIFDFDCGGTYNYHTKATIKLDGKRVTPEQAAAEWKAKKETHDFWASFRGEEYIQVEYAGLLPINYPATYELRPKQPTWTGSREDVLALLKEKGLL